MGPTFFARRGLALRPQDAPDGIVESLDQYAQHGQALERIAPAVREFFLRTRSLALRIEPRWRWWAVVFGWAWHGAARVLGQLCVPVVRAEIVTEVLGLAERASGRRAARGVLRRYARSGAAMQVIVYGVYEDRGEGFMSACFALPGSALEGILRIECVDEDPRGLCGARLTSEPRAAREGDPVGVFLETRWGRMRLPLGETLTLWDARSPSAPKELTDPSRCWEGCTVVGVHEQRLFGAVMVRHAYWFRPANSQSK